MLKLQGVKYQGQAWQSLSICFYHESFDFMDFLVDSLIDPSFLLHFGWRTVGQSGWLSWGDLYNSESTGAGTGAETDLSACHVPKLDTVQVGLEEKKETLESVPQLSKWEK